MRVPPIQHSSARPAWHHSCAPALPCRQAQCEVSPLLPARLQVASSSAEALAEAEQLEQRFQQLQQRIDAAMQVRPTLIDSY